MLSWCVPATSLHVVGRSANLNARTASAQALKEICTPTIWLQTNCRSSGGTEPIGGCRCLETQELSGCDTRAFLIMHYSRSARLAATDQHLPHLDEQTYTELHQVLRTTCTGAHVHALSALHHHLWLLAILLRSRAGMLKRSSPQRATVPS
jgi:hypothetical protein